MGADPIQVVQVACLHAARYFLLNNRGAIAPGYLADFAIVDNLTNFNVQTVYKKGRLVFDQGQVLPFPEPEIPDYLEKLATDTFHLPKLTEADFAVTEAKGLIGMIPGEILTENKGYADAVDIQKDILKMAVIERHKNTGHIGLGFLTGYGLKAGAVATSVAHDSHNIICVGANDADMAFAANRIAENHGGIVVVKDGQVIAELQLEIAGLMTNQNLVSVNEQLEGAKEAAYTLGISKTIDPFMTLSFMSLPVIPTLRLTTRGVVDVLTQQYI
jgi:adenine deaminase